MAVELTKDPIYHIVPTIQTPIVREGEITAWVIDVTMTHEGLQHSIQEHYVCAPYEVLPEFDPGVSRMLERILTRLENERQLVSRCAEGLKEKLDAQAA